MTDRPQAPRFCGVDQVARRPAPPPPRPDPAQRHYFTGDLTVTGRIAATPEERKP